MHNRHILEQALYDEIMQRDETAANTLIDLILSKAKGPSLSNLDSNGRSFLNLALANRLKSTTNRLFQILQHEPNILWGVDNMKRTLLSIAAEKGYVEFVEKLLDLSRHVKPGQAGSMHWFYADDIGNLPLHYAAQNRHSEVVKVLLNAMSIDKNYINSINHINHKVNTPLHLGCDIRLFELDADLSAILINHQADMSIPNENGETSFKLIRRGSPSFCLFRLTLSIQSKVLTSLLITRYK